MRMKSEVDVDHFGDSAAISYGTPLGKLYKLKSSQLDSAHYISFLTNDDLVVADKQRMQVKIYDEDGQYRSTVTRDVKPLGLATNRANMVAVVDDRSSKKKLVKVFSDTGDVYSSWGQELKWQPKGLAFSNKGQLLVTDFQKSDRRVGIYTIDGRELRTFGSRQFACPLYLTMDMFDRIIVSDRDDNCIRLYDDRGNALSRIGREGTEPGCLLRPRGVCTDSRGNIIVCDSGNRRISVFSNTGKYIQDLLTRHDYLRYPYDIAISKHSGFLAVSQHSGAVNGNFKKLRTYELPKLPPLKL